MEENVRNDADYKLDDKEQFCFLSFDLCGHCFLFFFSYGNEVTFFGRGRYMK